MNKGMKKRWISLYVENQVGVLSKISDRGPDRIAYDDRHGQ